MMRIFVGVSTTQLKAFQNLTYFMYTSMQIYHLPMHSCKFHFMYTSMQICLLSTHSCKFQLQYFHITSRSYESDVLWHLLLQQIGSSVILGYYPSMHLNHVFLQQIQPPCSHTYWCCLQIKWGVRHTNDNNSQRKRQQSRWRIPQTSLIPSTLFPPPM